MKNLAQEEYKETFRLYSCEGLNRIFLDYVTMTNNCHLTRKVIEKFIHCLTLLFSVTQTAEEKIVCFSETLEGTDISVYYNDDDAMEEFVLKTPYPAVIINKEQIVQFWRRLRMDGTQCHLITKFVRKRDLLVHNQLDRILPSDVIFLILDLL